MYTMPGVPAWGEPPASAGEERGLAMTITPQPSFLVLLPNVPVTLRVRAARLEDRPVTDPKTRRAKVLSVLVLEVDQVNGADRQTTLSFTSFKAQQTIAPLANSGELFRRQVQVTYRPKGAFGFGTEYEVVLV